jgi:hypothetical protein
MPRVYAPMPVLCPRRARASTAILIAGKAIRSSPARRSAHRRQGDRLIAGKAISVIAGQGIKGLTERLEWVKSPVRS